MLGGFPKYISHSFIIQENFSHALLERVLRSIAGACRKAGVEVVTGDTKVVDRGSCDGVFIYTAGIGEKLAKADLN